MRKLILLALVSLLLSAPAFGGGKKGVKMPEIRCVGCEGKPRTMKRNPRTRKEFMKKYPCPSTGKRRGRCPGFALTYIVPLERGGLDHPSNMQWERK